MQIVSSTREYVRYGVRERSQGLDLIKSSMVTFYGTQEEP